MRKEFTPECMRPDIREERDDRVLMVWGNLPYWTVMDREMAGVLVHCDGETTVSDVLGRIPGWRKKRTARQALDLFSKRGVFGEQTQEGENENTPARTPIENISVNVTRRCNLRCTFCYALDRLESGKPDECSLEEMIQFLEEVRPFCSSTASLTLLGGEPLLDAEKTLGLMRYAQTRSMPCIVSTNGTRITESFAREAAQTGAEIQVSLDGARAEKHESIRGDGTYERTMGGIRILLDAGVRTLISMVCHKGNLQELEAFYALGKRLGVDEVRFIPLKRLGGGACGEQEPVPLDDLMRVAMQMFREHPEYHALTGRDGLSILCSSCQVACERESCGIGVQTLLLDANGDLYPCLNTQLPELNMGSIRSEDVSFQELWTVSPVLTALRRDTLIHSPHSDCRGCGVRAWCLGGCRGETASSGKPLSAVAVNCEEQKKAVLEVLWGLSETPGMVKLPKVIAC